MAKEFEDLTGRKYGRWTVIEFAGRDGAGRRQWLCRCECGTVKPVDEYSLTSGNTKSCGCYRAQRSRECNTTHGGSHTRLHGIWLGIIQRCTNPKRNRFHRYGGRGIKVCDEWLHSYEAFRDWALANGYADDLTIERIDNNKGYYPENCCWIPKGDQAFNKTNSLICTVNGKTQDLALHVADPEINIHKLKYNTVRMRIKGGRTPEDAFSQPAEANKPVYYTIKGKFQTLAEHVADPEINVHNLNDGTVRERLKGGWTPEDAFSYPKGQSPNSPTYTINGKTQTLAEHVKDPEINVHNLKRKTVEARVHTCGQTLEEAFSRPLRGKCKSKE